MQFNLKGYSTIKNIDVIGREAWYPDVNEKEEYDNIIFGELKFIKIINSQNMAVGEQYSIVFKIDEIVISNLNRYHNYKDAKVALDKQLTKLLCMSNDTINKKKQSLANYKFV